MLEKTGPEASVIYSTLKRVKRKLLAVLKLKYIFCFREITTG